MQHMEALSRRLVHALVLSLGWQSDVFSDWFKYDTARAGSRLVHRTRGRRGRFRLSPAHPTARGSHAAMGRKEGRGGPGPKTWRRLPMRFGAVAVGYKGH